MPSRDMQGESHSLVSLFVAPLNRLGLKYMVTGSLATSIYGDPRLTNDIDLVVALPDETLEAVHAAFDPLHRWAIERRQATTVDAHTVWLAPPEYVVLRKLQYFREGGSEKHLRDVRAMLRQLGSEIDRALLDAEAARLGLRAELAVVS